jgi:hypothetical protein
MRYEQGLQVRLRERYRRLFKTDYEVYSREAEYFRQFILGTPALRAIVEALERAEPELDANQWINQHFDFHGYDWPPSEIGRAKVVWRLLNRFADGESPLQLSHSFSHESNINSAVRDLTEGAIEPLIEYLEERLGSESEILYLLERFKRRIEAFDQEELYRAYQANTRQGEDVYDRYLRRFLFDQGIDYPFSQPVSASGRADVISDVEGDDPLVCEVKLYDGRQYGIPYVGKGLTQAVEYAHDYGKTLAHLVIINLSEHGLQLPSDEDPKLWPPRLHVSGVTVYLVTVRAFPLPSASKRGRPTPKMVTRLDLVHPQD